MDEKAIQERRTRNAKKAWRTQAFPRILTSIVWAFFLVGLATIFSSLDENRTGPFFLLDGITQVMWPTVSLFSGMVMTYSLRYLRGTDHIDSFFLKCFAFTLSMLLLVASDHMALFLLAWAASGTSMAKLIGHFTGHAKARTAEWVARAYFFSSTLLLAVAVAILYTSTGQLTISGMNARIAEAPAWTSATVCILFLIAAMIRAGIHPFQGWLMSSMTTPTPGSALMHAGFVNAGAFLIARFSPVFNMGGIFWAIFLVGGLASLSGKFLKFVQTNYKRELACSTVAQMGFMLLQCGLGAYAAALTHLILHGFYKSHLFLSAGEQIERSEPEKEEEKKDKLWHLPLILLSGLLGGILFSYMTGKGQSFGTGTFLVFIVVLTIVHGSRDILRVRGMEGKDMILYPIIILTTMAAYSAIYKGVAFTIQEAVAGGSLTLSWPHYSMAAIYLIFFLIIELGLHKRSKRGYLLALNHSQPHSPTIQR